MEITSLTFLINVILFLAIYQIIPSRSLQVWILIGSVFFYASISPVLCGVLIGSILINYVIANSNKRRKNIVAVLFNLSLLASFKLQPNNYLLPIGVSFFSFQALSFIFDKKKNVTLLNFANYISFFPQLIAGPIESFDHLGPQIVEPKKIQSNNLIVGVEIILKGLVFKLVFADRCSALIDPFFKSPAHFDGWFLVISTLAFSFQILLDFSGYCLMAVGLAKILGIELSSNFNQPYLATNISSFWRNWHITLHCWFKKYVYQNINKGWIIGAFVVFFLSGLWHGLRPTYILWGIICFAIFVLDRILLQKINFKPFNWLITFFLISFSWIFFRVENMVDLGTLSRLDFDLSPIKLFIADSIYSLSNFNLSGILSYNSIDLKITYSDWFILLFGLPTLAFFTFKVKRHNLGTLLFWFLVLCFFGYTDSIPFVYLQF